MATRLTASYSSPEWSDFDRQRHSFIALACKCMYGGRRQVSPAVIQSYLRKFARDSRDVARTLIEIGLVLETADECRRHMLLCISTVLLHSPKVRAASGPLLRAVVRAGRPDVAKVLLQASAAGEASVARELLAESLQIASKAGHTELAALLAGAGAELDTLRNMESWQADPMSPLMQAAKHGHVGVAEVLLAAGASVNFFSEDRGVTALHHACECGQASIVRILMDAGANATSRLTYGHNLGAVPADLVRTDSRWGVTAEEANAVIRELFAGEERQRRRRRQQEEQLAD